MTPTVLVPVKPFTQAKSRLGDVLPGARRADLCRDLLAHTLGVLRGCVSVEDVIVISRDPAAWDLAGDYGVEAAVEPPDSGLNAALAGGVEIAARHQAAAVLVLPADLPTLGPGDIEALIAAAEAGAGTGTGASIVIAPDEEEDGTNALLLSLPVAIGFCFGPGSFAAHRAAAHAAGAAMAVVARPGLAFDLDTPRDYARLPPGFGGAA